MRIRKQEFNSTSRMAKITSPLWAALLAAGTIFAGATQGIADQWEDLVAAAQEEGQIVVSGVTGSEVRKLLTKGFQAQFPGIHVEYSGTPARSIAPRILSERRVGKKLWDVYVGGGRTPYSVFKPAGALVPLFTALVRPDVRGDKYWYGGVDFGFVDVERRYVYASCANLNVIVYANRSKISADKLTSPKQLIDPKFKGKIVMHDPRGSGAGGVDLASLLDGYGESYVKTLLTKQDVVFTRNYRQISEWLIRGRYPIAIGVSEGNLAGLLVQGLGKDVESVVAHDSGIWTAGATTTALFEGAPHPNAAKLFINWFLTKETQERFAKAMEFNSRRTDVSPQDPKTFPDPARLKQYPRNDETWNASRRKATDIARRFIK